MYQDGRKFRRPSLGSKWRAYGSCGVDGVDRKERPGMAGSVRSERGGVAGEPPVDVDGRNLPPQQHRAFRPERSPRCPARCTARRAEQTTAAAAAATAGALQPF